MFDCLIKNMKYTMLSKYVTEKVKILEENYYSYTVVAYLSFRENIY